VCLDVRRFDEKPVIAVQALLLHLQLTDTKKELLAVALHLKSGQDIEGEKIRLKQLSWFLPEVKKIQEEKEKTLKSNVPLFIGCDLNGPPVRLKEFEPFTYASIVSREQFLILLELHNKSVNKDEDKLNEKDFDYTDKWGVNLSSAYRDVLKAEPAYTTWKKRADGVDKHTIDYILYQPSKNVKVSAYLEIPNEKTVNQETLLPGWEYPSDHFSIMAKFQF